MQSDNLPKGGIVDGAPSEGAVIVEEKKNHHFDVHVYQKGVVWQFSSFLDIQVKIRFSFSS